MPLAHLLLALAVVLIWGTNFVVIKFGLADLPPFLFAMLRFLTSAVPWLLFVPRPPVAWRTLALFGVLLGAGQFGLMFYSLRSDISPGIASLVAQTQVFFTIGLAMVLHGERPTRLQWLALALAVVGMAVIGTHLNNAVTPLGLALVLVGALHWAGANLVAKSAGRVDMLGFMVWSSLFAVPPLCALSLWLDGWPAIVDGLHRAGWLTWLAVAWQAVGNTLFGYGAWNWLLARYPAVAVTPSALLVPVFGMGASSWLLAEPMPAWKLLAAGLVMLGLGLNVAASQLALRRLRHASSTPTDRVDPNNAQTKP